MPPYVSQWAPKRELQNAKFEGYKLSFDEDDDDVRVRIGFPSNAALPGRSLRPLGEERLGYKEARNRAKWNHLAVGDNAEAGWVDADGVVWLIDLKKTSEAWPKAAFTLPQPIGEISSASTEGGPAEYPVVRFLQGTIWAISDGTGRLYVVDLEQGILLAEYELSMPDGSDLLPFRLLCIRVHDGETSAILSSTLYKAKSKTVSGKDAEQSVYQVQLVRFKHRQESAGVQPLKPSLILHGADLPSYAFFMANRCCVGSTSTYKLPRSSFQEGTSPVKPHSVPYIPADEEVTGIPQSDGSAPKPQPPPSEPLPPPYSWNQTSDSLTIVFALPSDTQKKDIRIFMNPSSVSLTVMPSTSHSTTPSKLSLPHLNGAKLWDGIDSSISTWTWEKTGGEKGKYGVLALHLEKKHEDTRWPYVFKQEKEANPTMDKAYLEVEETMDRSELLKITEALEKYTADLAGQAQSGLQGGIEQRNTLLGDELDLEVDTPEGASGRGIVFTWIDSIDSDSPSTGSTDKAEMTDLVSLPLPVSAAGAMNKTANSIITKHDIDGLLFSPPSLPDDKTWIHESTYPALSFVLASKRDVVQVYHLRDKLCIGLESGSPLTSNGAAARASYSSIMTARMNAYLYYPPPPGSKAKNAKQRVVGLADPQAGAVLGAAAIERENGSIDLVVLCEKELVLIQGAVKG